MLKASRITHNILTLNSNLWSVDSSLDSNYRHCILTLAASGSSWKANEIM